MWERALQSWLRAVDQALDDLVKDLKRLKAESRRNVSVLQSRTQIASLSELGMTHELGIDEQSQAGILNNMCLLSLHETLPRIDPVLMRYIDSFRAPNVALFLRLIRCTNLMALEHLAKTHDTAACKDELQRHLLLFPVGTAADIDYIMQYKVSNPRNVHSVSLKTTADPKAVQSIQRGALVAVRLGGDPAGRDHHDQHQTTACQVAGLAPVAEAAPVPQAILCSPALCADRGATQR